MGVGILKREIKAPPLVVPLSGVSCLQLGEGREGKVIFFSYVGLPISAPRGLTTAKNIRSASWMCECWRWRVFILNKGMCWRFRKKAISHTYIKTCIEDENDLKITAVTRLLEAVLTLILCKTRAK